MNRVVVKFKDGTVRKGKTSDFFPHKNGFHLEERSGEMVSISTDELKAIFFVKDYEGNKERKKSYTDNVPGGGRKMEVTFKDGEKLIGYSQGYSPDRPGFFVIPADQQGNNERIFVLTAATDKVTFL